MRRTTRHKVSETKREAKQNLAIVAAAKAELVKLKVAINKAKKSLKTVQAKLKGHNKKATKNQKELDKIKAKASKAATKEKALLKKIDKGIKVKEGISADIQKAKNDYEEMVKELEADLQKKKDANAEHLAGEEAGLKKHLSSLRRKVERREYKVFSLDKDLAAKQKDLKELQVIAASLNEQADDYRELINKKGALKEELVSLSVEQDASLKRVKELKKEIGGFEKKVELRHNELISLNEEIKEKREQLVALGNREATLARKEKHLIKKCERFGIKSSEL